MYRAGAWRCSHCMRLPWMRARPVHPKTVPCAVLSLLRVLMTLMSRESCATARQLISRCHNGRPNQCTPNPDGGPYCTRLFGFLAATEKGCCGVVLELSPSKVAFAPPATSQTPTRCLDFMRFGIMSATASDLKLRPYLDPTSQRRSRWS